MIIIVISFELSMGTTHTCSQDYPFMSSLNPYDDDINTYNMIKRALFNIYLYN